VLEEKKNKKGIVENSTKRKELGSSLHKGKGNDQQLHLSARKEKKGKKRRSFALQRKGEKKIGFRCVSKETSTKEKKREHCPWGQEKKKGKRAEKERLVLSGALRARRGGRKGGRKGGQAEREEKKQLPAQIDLFSARVNRGCSNVGQEAFLEEKGEEESL